MDRRKVRRELHMLAAKREVTVQHLLCCAINDLLEKNGCECCRGAAQRISLGMWISDDSVSTVAGCGRLSQIQLLTHRVITVAPE